MRMTRTRTSSRLRAIQQASRGTAPMKPARSTRGRRRNCITRAAPRGHRRPQYQSRVNIICAGRRANTGTPRPAGCSRLPRACSRSSSSSVLSSARKHPTLLERSHTHPSSPNPHSPSPPARRSRVRVVVGAFIVNNISRVSSSLQSAYPLSRNSIDFGVRPPTPTTPNAEVLPCPTTSSKNTAARASKRR
ncbi:hypothetical protein B0H16DRAFT_239937 [Mycena metata]|uniref:Uncharacterized protein n=1 Tax=Mycena metata TaxID=1033252 RepID=A0AAD7MQV8_9AGAR|nr:hypothetical protein B0H16DRAFT_239937 [Mycena metata]